MNNHYKAKVFIVIYLIYNFINIFNILKSQYILFFSKIEKWKIHSIQKDKSNISMKNILIYVQKIYHSNRLGRQLNSYSWAKHVKKYTFTQCVQNTRNNSIKNIHLQKHPLPSASAPPTDSTIFWMDWSTTCGSQIWNLGKENKKRASFNIQNKRKRGKSHKSISKWRKITIALDI